MGPVVRWQRSASSFAWAASSIACGALVFASCMKNGGGTDLGPSGITSSALGTCEIPCATADDCRHVLPDRPAPITSETYWTCEQGDGGTGICAANQCLTDAHCSELVRPDYPDTTKGLHKCILGACTPPCDAAGKCAREDDVCTNAYCLHQPTKPVTAAECEARKQPQPGLPLPPCDCLTDDDCRAVGRVWTTCRFGICDTGATGTDAFAVGRPCVSDRECVRAHMSQDMSAVDPSQSFFGGCDIDANTCPSGLVCVGIGVLPSTLRRTSKGQAGGRTLCLPAECAPSGKYCAFSNEAPCASDADCPNVNRCDAPLLSGCVEPGDAGNVNAALPCKVDSDCASRHCFHDRFCVMGVPDSTTFNSCYGGTDAECPNLSRCLPGSPSSTCHPSLRECGKNEDCPGGEECMWPDSSAPGVCLAVTCASCAGWIAKHGGTRKCLRSVPDIAAPEIRRPD